MKHSTFAVAAAALTLALVPVVVSAFNIANPSRHARPEDMKYAASTSFEIATQKGGWTARLEVPADVAREIAKAAGQDGAAAGSLGGPRISPMQTIVSGLALSFAVVLGGLWFRRTKQGVRRQAVGLAIGGAVLVGLGAVAFGNAGPPPRYEGNLRKAFVEGSELEGPLQIVVVPEGNSMRLVMPAQSGKAD